MDTNLRNGEEIVMQILIVEDNEMVSEMLMDRFEIWHQQSVLATSKTEARLTFENNQFDLVLLDMMLPDGFGYELIPEIRQLDSQINIISMTGHNTPELERTVRDLGITYYLSKPIDFEELKSIIDHIEYKQMKEVA